MIKADLLNGKAQIHYFVNTAPRHGAWDNFYTALHNLMKGFAGLALQFSGDNDIVV